MEMTADVLAVLGIVRRVLSARTDWILEGENLMAEIEAKGEVTGSSPCGTSDLERIRPVSTDAFVAEVRQ
jgi:hypothetical protein